MYICMYVCTYIDKNLNRRKHLDLLVLLPKSSRFGSGACLLTHIVIEVHS